MAQTVITARESTQNTNFQERYVDREIARLTPNAAPLTVLLRNIKKISVPSWKPEHYEKGLPARWDQVNNGAGYASGDTAVVVDNAAYFPVGALVNVPRTGEHMRVTARVISTNTLTVSRSVGPTAAAALVDDDDLQILGTTYAEGAAKGTPQSHQPTAVFNYTEILRTIFGESESERQSQKYVGGEKDLMAEKLVEHMIDIERKMWFGERDIDTTSTDNPIRYMGGILYYATSNIKDFGGTFSEGEMEDWGASIGLYPGTSDTRTLFASPTWFGEIAQTAGARLQTVTDANATYGIRVSQWITGNLTFNIIKNRVFENGAGGTGYGEYAVALDVAKLAYLYLGDRNTKLRKNIETKGDDGYEHEYLTECCPGVKNPELAGVGKNIV